MFSQKVELSIFLIYQKRTNYHFKSFKETTINFLSIDVSLLYIKAKLFYKIWSYYIDIIIRIDYNCNYIRSKLD